MAIIKRVTASINEVINVINNDAKICCSKCGAQLDFGVNVEVICPVCGEKNCIDLKDFGLDGTVCN